MLRLLLLIVVALASWLLDPVVQGPVAYAIIGALIAWNLWPHVRRYAPLVSYSFRRWVRDTEGKIQAEQTRGKPEIINLLEQYKARKKSEN